MGTSFETIQKEVSDKAAYYNKMFYERPSVDITIRPDYEKQRRLNAMRKVPVCPEGVEVQKVILNGKKAEKLIKAGNKDDVIFYIHGGGFTGGSALERRDITYTLVDKLGYNVISVEYRLAPENKWPSQLEDCYFAYLGVLSSGISSQHIVLAGESAGGCLSLSLALHLRDAGKDMPKAVVALSPCTNMADKLPSRISNVETDYMVRNSLDGGNLEEALFGERKPLVEFLKNPYISPFYGDYRDVPPIFFGVSDTEVLRDDTVYLYERLKKVGHRVEMDMQHGVVHAYPIFPDMPESMDTLKKMKTFLEKL